MALHDFSRHATDILIAQMNADPGIPTSNPSVSGWQVPPHPLSEARSANLPPVTEFAIIGSGASGCSVASNLLQNELSGDQRVTVFEARTLTSGATGRNGGQLLTHIPKFYKTYAEAHGKEAAGRIARYALRTVDKMVDIAYSEDLGACEVRKVRDVMAFEDEEGFNAAVSSVRLYEEALSEENDKYSIIDKDSAKKHHQLKNAVGALTATAWAFWPYRLFTGIFQRLLDRYPNRFSIETRTPVLSIDYAPDTDSKYPYILSTPRGKVRASQVFHCCNGFTSHLLPRLQGKIFPYRGTMSLQGLGAQEPNLGSKNLWLFYRPSTYDSRTGILDSKLYYQHQNAVTGEIFCGGGVRRLDGIIKSDDEEVPAETLETLEHFGSKMFDRPASEQKAEGEDTSTPFKHLQAWTGIMGMTPDILPFVGKVPQSVTGRAAEGGEWIAAGYSGYGMPQCWSCGEAIARMALGESKPDWLPEPLLLSEKRLTDGRLSPEAALTYFVSPH
ncbi:hypothetical protein H2204_003351 [Knufia peltigerae]|uniref:FAD dependent oxidoreductase domain-containing protein n=1 Tax=Knufia peltigerae TaxID=1002370 RepID=A0AA38Y969_9EURO|nr:hypothetical protein H2204_003351 [Knufia peltigerae]